MTASYEALKLFTHKIWAKAERWMRVYTDIKKEETPLPFSPNRVQQVAEKYGLENYINHDDPTHKVYVQFAHHFEHVHAQDKTAEDKTILTGLTHHFLTTLERSTGTLDEDRLKETYHKASLMAHLFHSHLETHHEPLGMIPALRQANQTITQEDHQHPMFHLEHHALTTLKHQILHQEQVHQQTLQAHVQHDLNHTPHLGR